MGLELFGPEDENANVVTAVRTPEGIDGAAIPKLMRDRYGITIAGGQGHLKGKIVRIAHCGYYGAFDILTTIAGLEMALDELGVDVTFGAGVSRAQEVFARAGSAPRSRSVEPASGRARTATGSWSRRRSPMPAWTSCASTSTSTSAPTWPRRSCPTRSATTTRS